MGLQINLFTDKKQKNRESYRSRGILPGSILLFAVMLIAISGFYSYKIILVKESKILDSSIDKQKSIIASYKEIEERKSVLVSKTNEIQRIYNEKFDYLKAISDAQQLFGFSIAIESITLEKAGIVTVVSRKISDITLSQEQAFSTNIKELNLTVIVPSSVELKDTIDTLLGFEGQGLSSVIVKSTSLTDEGEYKVEFSITFSSASLNNEAAPAPVEVIPDI